MAAPPPSHLEQSFLTAWRLTAKPGETPPVREFVFAAPRRWRLDFAWPTFRVALEIQGGLFKAKSGHRSYTGVRRDHEKLNAAQSLGWIVLQIDGERLTKSPGDVLDQVRAVLASRSAVSE